MRSAPSQKNQKNICKSYTHSTRRLDLFFNNRIPLRPKCLLDRQSRAESRVAPLFPASQTAFAWRTNSLPKSLNANGRSGATATTSAKAHTSAATEKTGGGSPALAAYSNSIVAKPTLFPFARGGAFRLGLMGEAGPEAIMPLRRGLGGRLGVDASGIGERQTPQVNVNVINNISESADVSIRQSAAANGEPSIDVIIEQKVRGMFASGSMDSPMRGRFGLKPALMGR